MNPQPKIVPIRTLLRSDRFQLGNATFTVLSVDPDRMVRIYHHRSKTEAFLGRDALVKVLPPLYCDELPR